MLLKLENKPHFSLPNGVSTAATITMETIPDAKLFLDLLQHSTVVTQQFNQLLTVSKNSQQNIHAFTV